jgi:phosphoglucosamine mutase
VILVDDQGDVVDGDQVMAILAIDLKEQGLLEKNTLVTTPMSNMGLEICLKDHNIEMVRTPVGDRFVVDRMRKEGFNLGGEQSGHIIFLDNSNTGDGVVAALRVLAVMKRKEKALSHLRNVMRTFPQVLRNITVKNKRPLESVPAIQKSIQDVHQKLGSRGRLLVRYSGTEPLCRVMIEGEDESLISGLADTLCDVISKNLEA